MARRFSLFIVFVLTALVSVGQDSYAIKNVSVITMSKEEVLPDQTVVVEKGIIKNISPAAKIKLSKGVKVIDGKGKFVTPGFWDMHVHTVIGRLPELYFHCSLPMASLVFAIWRLTTWDFCSSFEKRLTRAG